MALTLTKEPEVISLSKDPIVYEFQTDNMVVSAGTAAVNKITFTTGVAVDDVIVINWAGQELRMVAKAVPVLSNEFLAGTSDLNVLLPYFRDNYTIEKDFVVSIVSGKIDLTARNAGTKYNIDDVSFTGGTITTPVSGVDAVVRKNFAVYFEVWMQKDDGTDTVVKVHDDIVPVDRLTSKVSIDISQVVHSELKEDLPWEFVANAGLCVKSKRKYYVRYAEVFGEKLQVQRLSLGATKHVVLGGSSLIGRKTVVGLLQGASANADACMRIGDTTRYVLPGEEQYLFFLALRADAAPVLQATITYSDASTEVKYGLGYGTDRYGKIYFRASLAVFEPNVSKTVVQYVVKVVDGDNGNAALSKAYTYVIDYSVRKSVRNFFYVNSLGAVDEFVTFGKGSTEVEFYKDSAEKAISDLEIEAQEEDYNIEGREFFEAATGFRSKRELAYMRDFFLSSRKYVKNLGKYLPIILANKRIREREDGQNLNGYKFEYSLAYSDDSLSDSDLSEIIGYPLPPQGFLGGGNVTVTITEPAGIVIDAVPTIGSSNAVSSNGVAVALDTKQDFIAVGTELQYIRGDGTLGTLGNEVNVLGGSVFDDKWVAKNTAGSLALGYGSGNIAIGNFENDSLTKILGRFGVANSNNFLAEFSANLLTANCVVTLPDRNIEINKWADLSGVPDKLSSLINISTNGIIRQTGINSFAIGTNDPITLSGDVSGTGTTSIPVILANTTVAAGTYKSVTVDPKGRVVAATNPTTIAGYGITDFADNWNTQWNVVSAGFINFQSSVEINQNMTVGQDLYVYGKLFDSVLSEGSASGKQVLRSTNIGFRWTTLDKSYISDFSTGVLGQLLTGLVAGSNTAISSSNTILTAFQNLQAQITNKTIDKLTFGVGYLQNSSDGLGFVYKPSGISTLNNIYYTGEFRVNEITQNRTWKMPNYDGTLTTYEKINTEFWRIGGNADISQDAVFDINSIFINSVQNPGYNYLWKINGSTKMQLTPQGNFSVGGIAPEAVIHAHATVVGNAEVIALKATNQTSYSFFSIGIDSNNNRTNFYAGGEVWATTISKFKFGAADVSGLWNYLVVPQTTSDATTGNQLVRLSQVQNMLAGGFSVSTACKLVFTDNQSLSGVKTQGGYTTVTGDSILLTGQSTASQNGVYVFDGTNWTRNTANDTDSEIRDKGHLITAGTYAGSQWVNSNSSAITIGSTAITYIQWSGAELDPVWEAYKVANDLTPTRFSNWNTAYGWGNHANLYVDKFTTQNNIAGAKTFTTSIQSPIVRAGTDALNITMFNVSGNSPRIASNSTLEFFATTRFDWLTTGSIGRMRLTTSGLRIGSTSDPLYKLHVVGTTGLEGLISLGNTPQNIAMSSGSVGQYIRRSLVSNGFYNVDVNEWANITTSDIVGLSANYQAKLNGSGFVKMNGTELNYENFGEFGQYQTHTQYANISSIPWGASFVNGTTTDLPNNGLQAHVVKMSIGSEYPSQATYLAIPRPFGNYFDGQIYVRGIYGVVDSGWISVGGGNFKDYDFDEYEATIKYHGYFYNNTPEGREGFIGFNRLDGGVILEYKYTEIDSNVTTTYRNFMDSSGRLCYQIDNGSAKRYALLEEVATGSGGVAYTLAEPLYFSGNQINIRTASASQIGALSAVDWDNFNKKLSDGGIINDSLKVAFAKIIRFMASNGTDVIHKQYSTWTGTNKFHEDTTGDRSMGVTGMLELNANRYFLNGFEIDMSGFATGKVLKATSSSKAEWVTL